MIKETNIESVANRINYISKKIMVIKNNIGINYSTIKNFRENELPNIVSSSGANISKPFYKKKNDNKKFREYNVPSNFIAGVYTGETYYALSNDTNTKNIKIVKTIKNNFLYYGYESNTPRNFNIALSSQFLQSETKHYRDRIEKILQNILK